MFLYVAKFLYILKGKHKQLVILAIMALVVSLMETVGIGLIGPFIAIATDPTFLETSTPLKLLSQKLGLTSNIQFLFVFGVILTGVFFLKALIGFIVQRYIFRYGFGTQGDLQARLMRAYLAAPYTFHLSRNTATLMQSILKDTEVFCNGVMMPVLFSCSNLAIMAGLISLVVFTSPLATLIIGGILFVGYFLVLFLKDRMARWGRESGEASTEMIRVINHALGGVKETRVIGCESYFSQQMETQSQRFARMASNAVSASTLPRYILEAFLITFLIIITLIFLAFNQQSPQQLSAVLGIFALASIRLMPAASNLMGSINGIRYASYAVDKVYFDLKELESLGFTSTSSQLQLASSAGGASSEHHVMSFVNEIVLEKVNYCYPTGTQSALDEVSLRIQKGQSIGLIGRSGAGKTTMVDVILGLLTPQSGDIQVDGVSIYSDIRAWQNLVGYVPQSIFLMDDTLEKNIAFGVPAHLIERDHLYSALKSSQLLELVEQLPDGLQTMMGERGVRLSGGQRQRVGIARALYHQREVLVLDEATAALDNETEKLISESIQSLSGNKTVIIIAHRLSTIEHCDCVYMMEKGRVVKSGTYREVISAS
jgi:ABC-type multidrug transport system fused ATPase/permease subunit